MKSSSYDGHTHPPLPGSNLRFDDSLLQVNLTEEQSNQMDNIRR